MPDHVRSFQTRTLPWLLVAGLVIVVAVMWFNRSGRPTAEAPQAIDPEPAAAPASRSRPFPVPTPSGARAAIAHAASVAKARRAATQARVDQIHAKYGTRYASERIDPAWSASKEQELVSLAKTDAMTQMGANVSNLSVDCRTTMCDIQGDFPNTSSGDDWFTLYMTNVGSKVPTASYKYEHKPDGTVRIHIYAVGRR